MLNKTRWRNSSTVLASYCFLCIRNKPKEFSNGCGANSFLTSKNKKSRVFCPVSCTAMIKKGLCTTCCIYAPVLWKSVFLKCRVSATSPFISEIFLFLDSGASNKHEYLHYLQMECPSSVTKCPVGIS